MNAGWRSKWVAYVPIVAASYAAELADGDGSRDGHGTRTWHGSGTWHAARHVPVTDDGWNAAATCGNDATNAIAVVWGASGHDAADATAESDGTAAHNHRHHSAGGSLTVQRQGYEVAEEK